MRDKHSLLALAAGGARGAGRATGLLITHGQRGTRGGRRIAWSPQLPPIPRPQLRAGPHARGAAQPAAEAWRQTFAAELALSKATKRRCPVSPRSCSKSPAISRYVQACLSQPHRKVFTSSPPGDLGDPRAHPHVFLQGQKPPAKHSNTLEQLQLFSLSIEFQQQQGCSRPWRKA